MKELNEMIEKLKNNRCVKVKSVLIPIGFEKTCNCKKSFFYFGPEKKFSGVSPANVLNSLIKWAWS